jgi:hypothetical protein
MVSRYALSRSIKSIFLVSALLIAEQSLAEQLLKDQDLHAEPNVKSSISGKAKKGDVTVLGKKGFWLKIKAGDVEGWTKISNVKVEKSLAGIGDLTTGREGSNNIVSTSGTRGLDGADLEKADPDLEEFSIFSNLKVSSEDGAQFAAAGKLMARKVDYVQPVADTSKR